MWDYSLELLPNRLSSLVELSSSEWIETFNAIEKHVNIILKEQIKYTGSSIMIGTVAMRLTYPKTFKSFCNFVNGPKIDDRIRKIVSNLILIFSDTAYKLYKPSSIDLSESLKTLAHDISLGSKGKSINFHPIETYFNEIIHIMRDIPEDYESDFVYG